MQKVEFDDFRSWIVAVRRAPYLALFDWHRERGDAKGALQVVERMQGRMFLDALGAAANAAPTQQPRDVVARLEWLRRFYPALRATPMLDQTPPIGATLRELADREVLVFFEAEDALYLVQIRGGRPKFHRAPDSLPNIRRHLATFLAAKGVSVPDQAAADSLAQALFPVSVSLPPAGTLDVVLSPSLARLPLVALPYRGQPLLRRLTVVHAPSVTALAALRRRPARTSGPSLVLADAQSDLPGAASEGEGVQALLGGPTKAPLKLGPEATASLLLGAKSARVIHLALHSDVSPAGPFLRLSDRPLYAGDVLAARLESNLVVLASCASSVSLDPGLWGSIVVAFLAGGASSVLGTLWSVDDAVSRQFVLDFYRAGGASDAPRALTSVQREWMSRERPLTEWGAFVLFGRPPG
jgi:CHAT domain-containing protein